MSTIIETFDLHKYYYMKNWVVKALRGINLKVNEGEYLSIWVHLARGKPLSST